MPPTQQRGIVLEILELFQVNIEEFIYHVMMIIEAAASSRVDSG